MVSINLVICEVQRTACLPDFAVHRFTMADTSPLLYVKTGCPWCEEVLDFLDRRGIAYQKITVTGNPAAMQAMVDLSGQSKAPTMDWNGEVLADFGVDELIPFLKERGVI